MGDHSLSPEKWVTFTVSWKVSSNSCSGNSVNEGLRLSLRVTLKRRAESCLPHLLQP